MSRMIRTAFLLGLPLGLCGMTPSQVSAQFSPGAQGLFWSVPWNRSGGYFNYQIVQAPFVSIGLNSRTGPYMNGFGYAWSSIPLPGFYPHGAFPRTGGVLYYPGAFGSGYTYGGVGTYAGSGSGVNPVTQAQLQAFALAHNPKVGNEIEARKAAVERWAQGTMVPVGVGDPKKAPQIAIPNLTNAPEAVIHAGTTINDLVTVIREREGKGAKADAPMLPVDLLRHLQLTGGPAAGTLMLLRSGEVQYPDVLTDNRFAAIRSELEKPLAAVVGPLMSGKKTEPLAGERLLVVVKKVRTELTPSMKQLPKDEQASVSLFLDRLTNLGEVAKAPGQYAGLIVPKWFRIGVNASEFAAILSKFQVKVLPAQPDDAEAYQVLHRGLANYVAVLPLAKQ